MENNKNGRRVLVAPAWPYANGPLHLGHIAALIGADVLARYHRAKGDQVLMVSGSDCYGTPIAVEAAKRGVSPASIAEHYHAEFVTTLINDLHFSYDFYGRTTSPHHAELVRNIFLQLYEKEYIYTKTEQALYSPLLKRFLPDRFVEGECPYCGFADARGDQCDECGKLTDPLTLKNPRVNKRIVPEGVSASDVLLEVRDTEQFFLKLTAFQRMLEKRTEAVADSWRVNAAQITRSFLKQGLQDRAVTRDTDWGIPVPVDGYEEKKIYVWFEAVLGYLSASQEYFESRGEAERWKEWWCADDALHYYVHGKDNVPFHSVILPALLSGADNLHLPDRFFSSEHLSLEGGQFSTSRSHAVWVSDFLAEFDAELLRYFMLAHGPETGDVDFRWAEFAQLVNGELIGTFGNLVNRICSFAERQFPEGVSVSDSDHPLLSVAEAAFTSVGGHIERGEFRAAFREILRVAEEGNRFAHNAEPWKTVGDSPERARADTAILLHCVHTLGVLVEPFLPETSKIILGFFGDEGGFWRYIPILPEKTISLRGVKPLFSKISDDVVERCLIKLQK